MIKRAWENSKDKNFSKMISKKIQIYRRSLGKISFSEAIFFKIVFFPETCSLWQGSFFKEIQATGIISWRLNHFSISISISNQIGQKNKNYFKTYSSLFWGILKERFRYIFAYYQFMLNYGKTIIFYYSL